MNRSRFALSGAAVLLSIVVSARPGDAQNIGTVTSRAMTPEEIRASEKIAKRNAPTARGTWRISYLGVITRIERAAAEETRVFKPSDGGSPDDVLEIDATLLRKGIALRLRNVGTSSVRILWDEASLVDEKGEAHRTVHEGVRFIDRSASQPPTLIPAGASVSDSIGPSDGITFSGPRGWEQPDLLPSASLSRVKGEVQTEGDSKVGKRFVVVLPVEKLGKRFEYSVTVDVAKAMVERGSWLD